MHSKWKCATTTDCTPCMLNWCVYDRDLIYNLDYVIKTYRIGQLVEHKWYFRDEENAILFALRW